MSAASAGVSELMDAEKKASTVVAEARAARSDRLKAAKAEAGAARKSSTARSMDLRMAGRLPVDSAGQRLPRRRREPLQAAGAVRSG